MLRGGYGMFYGFLGQRRGDVIHERLQRDHQPDAVARQRPDVHRDAVESVPGGIQEPVGRRAGHRRRSSARASRSSIRTRSRRGCSAGRSACSASCRAAGCVEASYVGNHGSQLQTIAQHQRDAELQYLSTSPVRDQATHRLPRARNVPNPFFGLMPVDRRRGASAARTSPASGCCVPTRSSTPSTRRPTKASRGTTRCRLDLQRRFAGGYTIGVELHLLAASPRRPSS